MKQIWRITQGKYDIGFNAVDHIDYGPFGLFNIDIYDFSKERPAARPFKRFFCQQQDVSLKDADFQYIVGVVDSSSPGNPRNYSERLIDACWDPTDPDADLKQAMQFLMDLVNARGM